MIYESKEAGICDEVGKLMKTFLRVANPGRIRVTLVTMVPVVLRLQDT
jgi:hypothetical protein